MPTKKPAAKKPAAKKPAAKKPAAKKTAGGAVAGGDSAPTYGWAEIVRRAKAPSDAERALYAVQVAPDVLRGEGIKIASERILTDALRWSGTLIDFVAGAAPELVREVRGFSGGLLRVFVAEAHRLYELNQRFQADLSVRKAGAKVDKAAASGSRKLAQSYRRQLFETLKGAAQHDGEILRRLAEAFGALDLSTALRGMVALARELCANQSAAGQRLILGGVDASYLATVEKLADQADETGSRVTGPRKSAPVSQGELDVQDGVCLVLMDGLLSLFKAARDINPQIPNLIPIATRRYFVSHKAGKKSPNAPVTPPNA